MNSRKRKLPDTLPADDDIITADNVPVTDSSTTDYFSAHFDTIIDDATAARLLGNDRRSTTTIQLDDTTIGSINYVAPNSIDATMSTSDTPLSFDQFHIVRRLIDNFAAANGGHEIGADQSALHQIIGRYVDFMGTSSNDRWRIVYCLHALNHVLRTRNRILSNKMKLQQQQQSDDSMRDQGMVRPKVLILCPFRKTALRIVEIFSMLLFGKPKSKFITDRKRFYREFSDDGSTIAHRKGVDDDYKQLMTGNIDDCFRVGIGISKKCLKLYTDFYESDILLASPLGLRMIVGDDAEKHHEHDFLASIEILILDQADIFLMQNWQHVLHLFSNINRRPDQMHDVDVNRIRVWTLNGWSKVYRQTIVLTDVLVPEIRAIFSQHCHNRAGCAQIQSTINGCLPQDSIGRISQTFCRFDTIDPLTAANDRFTYFVNVVYPKLTIGTLIFVPSYLDFVRVRNFLKRENASFVQMCEYSEHKKIARARDMFYHAETTSMLITERVHFFRRYRIKGVKRVIFYQLPIYAKFYVDVIGWIQTDGGDCSTIYCRFDAMRLANLVGQHRAATIINARKKANYKLSVVISE